MKMSDGKFKVHACRGKRLDAREEMSPFCPVPVRAVNFHFPSESRVTPLTPVLRCVLGEHSGPVIGTFGGWDDADEVHTQSTVR